MATSSQVIEIILRARNELSAGLQAAEGQLAGFASKLDEIGARYQAAGAVLLGAGGGMAGAMGVAAKGAADYQTAMNVLQATSSATADQMARMGQLAVELGADLSLPATSAADAGNAMKALVENGVSVENTIGAVRGTLQLAAAAHMDEARAAEITANALNTFKMAGSDAGRVADLLASGATRSGTSLEQMAQAMQMSGAIYAASGVPIAQLITLLAEMARAGIKGSDAGTSLKEMMLKLQGPSKESAAVMAQFGINVYDSMGRMRPLVDIIAQFSAAFKGYSQQQRDAALATIFGSDAVRAANVVLLGGVDAFQQMGQAVTQPGRAAQMAAAYMQGLGGAVEGAKSQFETLLLSVGQAAAGGLERFVRAISGVIDSLIAWDKHNQGVIANVAMSTAITLTLAGAASLAAGTLLRLAAGALTVGASMATGALGIAGMVQGLLELAGSAIIAGARFIWLAGTGQIGLVTMISGFARWAAAAVGAAATTAAAWAAANAPLLVGVAVVGLLYVAWRTNFLGIQGITQSVVSFIGSKLNDLLTFINHVLTGLGLAPIEWGKAWDSMQKTAEGAVSGVKGVVDSLLTGFQGGDVLGGLAKTLGLGDLSDLRQQVAQATNLPQGQADALLQNGQWNPAGGAGGLGENALVTGDKLSDLAQAAQKAMADIGSMAQAAVDASLALGKMPGIQGFKPGENGPFENVYRLQDVAQNLGAKDRPEVAARYENGKLVGGQGPVETSKWAATLRDQSGTLLSDVASSLHVGVQEYARTVLTKFQQGFVNDPEVKRWIDIPKWQDMIKSQSLAGQQQVALSAEVGGTPDMMRAMLGGQGLAVSQGQAQILADAAKDGTLQQIAKGSLDQLAAINQGTTTVAGAVSKGSENIVAAIVNGRNATANLPPVMQPLGPVLSTALSMGRQAAQAATQAPPLAQANQVTGQDWAAIQAALNNQPALGAHALLLPMAPSVPTVTGPYTPVNPATWSGPNWTTGNAPLPVTVVNPEKPGGIQATVPSNQTNSVSITIAPGAVSIEGGVDPGQSLAAKVNAELSDFMQALVRAAQGGVTDLAPSRQPGALRTY
jgi:TP901 family phage tail tape measure protein